METSGEKGRQTDEGIFLEVLDESMRVVDRTGAPWALIGGIGSAALGRPRWSHRGEDIDFFLRPEDARRVLEELAEAGFETEETYPDWLFKAYKKDVLVDVIFKSSGDIFLDDEMLSRVRIEEFKNRKVKVPSPEDLVVMKAVAHSEETPQYWFDALSIIARSELDWDYVCRRARRHGVRRVLSLLLYAQSVDLVVPMDVVRKLFEMIQST